MHQHSSVFLTCIFFSKFFQALYARGIRKLNLSNEDTALRYICAYKILKNTKINGINTEPQERLC